MHPHCFERGYLFKLDKCDIFLLNLAQLRPNSQPVEAPPEQAPLEQVPERDDLSDRSRLTLEEEGLNLDDPSKPGLWIFQPSLVLSGKWLNSRFAALILSPSSIREVAKL